MLIDYALSQTSIILRVKLRQDTTGAKPGNGITALTSSSAGLIISTIADNEATPTTYTQAGSTIEAVTTLGTFAAPTATKCRFKKVDDTNNPGIYEIQIADARFAVSSAKSLLVSISGVTGMSDCDVVIPLRSVNPYDGVHGGMTALPNTACTTNASLLTSGTGTDQLSVTTGRVDVGKALGTAVTLDSNNVLNVSAKYWAGTAITATSIPVATAAGAAGGLFIAGSNAATTISGLTTGALSCTTITASGAVAFQSTFAVTTSTALAAITGTTLTLSGAVAFQSTFAVTTSTALGAISGSTLTLSGAVAFQSTFIVTGAVTFSSTFATTGTTTFNALTITNATTFTGAVTGTNAANDLRINGAVPGAAGGLFIAGTNAATTVTTSFTTTFTGNLTGSVGSVTGAVGSVTGNVGGSVGSVTAGVTVTTNNDKTGYSLTVTPPTAATIATTVWQDLTSGSDFSTANSIGALLKADINAPIGSIPTTPLLAANVPANFAALLISVTGHISNVDTLTTYTGNTVQTGDSYARIGAGGVSLTALDVATIGGHALVQTLGKPWCLDGSGNAIAPASDSSAIKAKTDQLTFTVLLHVDATASIGGNVTVGGYASGQDPATLVLDAAAASHNSAGTIGQKINAAGGAADPLLNAVPGSYAPGTAGYELGNLGVTVWDTALPGSFASGSAGWRVGFIYGPTQANAVGPSSSGKTVISGTVAYCTPAQFLQRYDYRTVGRLLLDAPPGPLGIAKADVLADPNLATFLLEASGEVEMACLLGEYYTVGDLIALVSTNGGEKLAGLVADLTMWRVYDRRPDKAAEMPQRCEIARGLLDALAEGKKIFPFLESAKAGHLNSAVETPPQVVARNGSVVQSQRYWGRRADRNLPRE